VVRPCAHGGLWGQLTRDLYLGPERARKEIRCSFQLQAKKIPTPCILAVLFYPAGPFHRIDIITSYVPESHDLASFLSTRPKLAERTRAFASVRHLFKICAQHGFHHADMNARNILLSGSLNKKLEAWLLDVDAVTRNETNSDHVDTSNKNRLLRSLLKRARSGDLGYSEREIPALWRELFPRK
jgi:tRNA A-37 threonylcarbamoyl transferase component Bud32